MSNLIYEVAYFKSDDFNVEYVVVGFYDNYDTAKKVAGEVSEKEGYVFINGLELNKTYAYDDAWEVDEHIVGE